MKRFCCSARTPGITLLLVGMLSIAAVVVSAGGWGVLTIKHLPEYAVAGEPLHLTFAMRGHGRALSSGLSATLEATSGRLRVHTVAAPANEPGHYTAGLTLPAAGDWVLSIQTSYGPRQSLRLPLKVIERSSPSPILSAVERGGQLFLAKGCMTCHRHDAVESNHPSPVGPPLTSGIYQPEYVARLLANPAAAVARPAGPWPWTMPDLELTEKEIDGLVAFLTSGTRASRAPETWKAVFVGPIGSRPKMVSQMTFELETEGNRLTGMAHMANWPGSAPVSDGRIEGNRVSFTVVGRLPWCSSSSIRSGCGYPHLAFSGTVQDGIMTLALDWGSLVEGQYVSAAEWPAAGMPELQMEARRMSR